MKENKFEKTDSKLSSETKADNSPASPTKPTNQAPISKLSLVAIGLTLCLGGFVFYHGHQEATRQNQTIAELQSELATLQNSLKQNISKDINKQLANITSQQNEQFTALEQKVNQNLDAQTQSQQQVMTKVDDAIKITERNFTDLNERLSAISTTDHNVWLISQANYLVNIAGRKIWSEQDYATARLLLRTADSSLAQANDPSLLPARQAIHKDISDIAAISSIDFDGIVLSLLTLTDTVTQLPLVENYQGVNLTDNQANNLKTSVPTKENNSISSSIYDWYDNLIIGSQSFLQKFIQVEKYDNFGECIAEAGQDKEKARKCQTLAIALTPEQMLYLRENIKLRLLIAAQAVPRHQESVYQQALNDVSFWVNAYFDHNATNVKTFLNDVDKLKQQNISDQNVPQQLSSREEMNKLMKARVNPMLLAN